MPLSWAFQAGVDIGSLWWLDFGPMQRVSMYHAEKVWVKRSPVPVGQCFTFNTEGV